MKDLGAAAGWGIAVAASLAAGAVAGAELRLPRRLAATITAFGGGLLLAAIAFELVPEADAEAGPWLTSIGLLVGTLVYVGADAWLTRDEGMMRMRRARHAAAAGMPMDMPAMPADHSEAARGESIAVGLFVDGVPESVALGLTVAQGAVNVALLAGILIGNTVEAYGAAQPIVGGGRSKGFAVALLAGIGLALAAATVVGATVLADASPSLVGTTQAFAAGAVLAVVTVSIVPHAFSEVSSFVAFAAVLGFIVGYMLG